MYPVPWRVIRPPCFVFFPVWFVFWFETYIRSIGTNSIYIYNLYTYTCIYHKTKPNIHVGKYTIYTMDGLGKRLVGSGSRPSSPALIRQVLPCGMWNVPLQRIPSVAARWAVLWCCFPKRVGWKLWVGWIRVFLTIQGGPSIASSGVESHRISTGFSPQSPKNSPWKDMGFNMFLSSVFEKLEFRKTHVVVYTTKSGRSRYLGIVTSRFPGDFFGGKIHNPPTIYRFVK